MQNSLLTLCFIFSSFAVAGQSDLFVSYKIMVEGSERTYHVHKPNTTPNPLPLLVVLHGGGGNGKGLKDTYGFKPFIESGEFIAIYPDAGPGGWLPEHVLFLDAVIDDVLSKESIDSQRLFITGASRGGLMTFIMTQRSRHLFAGAGTVIASHLQGLLDEAPFQRPVDFAMIAGTEDPLMPYAGGWGAMRKPKTNGDPGARVLPVEEVIASLVKLNGISAPPTLSSLGNSAPEDGCTNEVYLYTNMDRRVLLVKVIGGGHVVPGGRQYLSKNLIGAACFDFDHAEVMWEFFKSAADATSATEPALIDTHKSDTEKALRSQVVELFEATRTGKLDRCIELSDPAVVAKVGRSAAEKFFRNLHGLMKITKVGPDDHNILSVKIDETGQSAQVQAQVRINNKWRPASTEIWTNVEGSWRYQETTKK